MFAAALVSCAPEPQAKDPPRIAANQITIFQVDASGVRSAVNSADFVGLQIGDSKTLSAEVSPATATDKAITWSSSAPAVVVIDAVGKFEAKGSGNAIITASAGGAAATLSVSVKYNITSETQLRDISQNLAGYYVLQNDITLTQEWTPLGVFTGTLDGAGYSVKNLWINKPSQSYVGLIGENKGTIKNIGVELAQQDISGRYYTGALVGRNYGTVSGRVTGAGKVVGTDISGGLVGGNSKGTVIGYATIAVEGLGLTGAGGLVGQSTGGLVVGYATGAVTAPHNVGGLVGYVSDGMVIGYARGAVTGTDIPGRNVNFIGGLIGSIYGGTISGYARGAVSTDREGFVAGGQKQTFVGPAVGRGDAASAANLYYSGKIGESGVTAPTGVTPNTFGTQESVAAGDDSGVLAARFINLSSAYWLFPDGTWPAIDFPADQSIFDSVRGDKQPVAP